MGGRSNGGLSRLGSVLAGVGGTGAVGFGVLSFQESRPLAVLWLAGACFIVLVAGLLMVILGEARRKRAVPGSESRGSKFSQVAGPNSTQYQAEILNLAVRQEDRARHE